MRLRYFVKGFPGHPLHPPLTDATTPRQEKADQDQARAGLTRY